MKTETLPHKILTKGLNTLHVFVVEDNPAYSFMLSSTLEHEFSFNILTFDSGEACLLNLEKNRPLIVILDYNLKNMNGANVLNYIKRNYPEIYVIVLSNQPQIRTAVEIMKRGAFEYIQKSRTSFEELRNTIFRILIDIDASDQKSLN